MRLRRGFLRARGFLLFLLDVAHGLLLQLLHRLGGFQLTEQRAVMRDALERIRALLQARTAGDGLPPRSLGVVHASRIGADAVHERLGLLRGPRVFVILALGRG